jgi:hypothetical protein
MKYFTRERLLRFGNTEDEQTFLAGLQEWEDALSAYRAHLDAILGELPRDLKRLVKTVYLHDARVLSTHQEGDRFVITLQPESDPQRLVVLSYTTISQPVINPDGLFEEQRSEPIAWLYDELDVDRTEGPQGAPAQPSKLTFCHTILLSNGWEIEVRFRTVSVRRPIRIIPVATNGRADQATVVHSG